METDRIIFKEDGTYEGLTQIMRDSGIVLAFTSPIHKEISEETYKTLVDMENYYTRFVLATQDINRNYHRYGNRNVIELDGNMIDDINKIKKHTKSADIILVIGDISNDYFNNGLINYFYENAEDPGCIILSDTPLKDAHYSLNGIGLNELFQEAKRLPSYKDINDLNKYKEKYYKAKLGIDIAHEMLCLSSKRLSKMSDSEQSMCIGLAAELMWRFDDDGAKKGVGKWRLGEYVVEDRELIEIIPSRIIHPTKQPDKNHPFHKIWDAKILLTKHYFKESAYM